MCFVPQRRALFRHLNFQKWSEHGVFSTFDFEICFAPQPRALFRHLNFQKWSEPGAFYMLTSKCASRHNGVHFFDISTSKSGPSMCALYILTSKCASCHNGVQFFISHLASWLRTRRFSEPTFRPSGASNHWKNTLFRDIPTFSRTWIFFLLGLSLLWSSFFFSSLMTLPISAFHLSILLEVWLLNFLRSYIYISIIIFIFIIYSEFHWLFPCLRLPLRELHFFGQGPYHCWFHPRNAYSKLFHMPGCEPRFAPYCGFSGYGPHVSSPSRASRGEWKPPGRSLGTCHMHRARCADAWLGIVACHQKNYCFVNVYHTCSLWTLHFYLFAPFSDTPTVLTNKVLFSERLSRT